MSSQHILLTVSRTQENAPASARPRAAVVKFARAGRSKREAEKESRSDGKHEVRRLYLPIDDGDGKALLSKHTCKFSSFNITCSDILLLRVQLSSSSQQVVIGDVFPSQPVSSIVYFTLTYRERLNWVRNTRDEVSDAESRCTRAVRNGNIGSSLEAFGA